MRILVNDIEGTKIGERIVNAQDIICPKCKESIKIKIENYKKSLYGCKNGHKTVNILFDEFENTQKINEREIKFGNCNNNKSNIYNKVIIKLDSLQRNYYNEFYKCHQCGINICPICKSIHDKNHIKIFINKYIKFNIFLNQKLMYYEILI